MRCDLRYMCFQMLPELSVAGDMFFSSRKTVPHARSCDSEASVAESGTRAKMSVDDDDYAQRRVDDHAQCCHSTLATIERWLPPSSQTRSDQYDAAAVLYYY